MRTLPMNPQPSPPSVAFLGTGIMGAPMAINLLRAGFPVTVWNRTPARTAEVAAAGARVAASPSEAVSAAQFVVVMVSTGEATQEVLFAPDANGVTPAQVMPRNVLIIVMGSIRVDAAIQQAQQARHLGLRYLDAPVSGGESGARLASLSIMVGGDPADVAQAQPILTAMGRVQHIGASGCGQVAKLANQLVVGITIGAVAEALLLAAASGADVTAVREAMLNGFAASTVLREHGARMIRRDFAPGAFSRYQAKDMDAATAQASAVGLQLPILDLVRSLYSRMKTGERAELDHSALFLLLDERSREPGVVLGTPADAPTDKF